MIILEIIGGLLVLFLAAQILGRLARFVWIPILSSVIAGLVVGISSHSLWGGIGTGIAVLIVFGISSAIVAVSYTHLPSAGIPFCKGVCERN